MDVPRHFCIAPWVSLSTRAGGEARPCCVIGPDGFARDSQNKILNLNETPLEEVWNSKSFRNLRKEFIEGHKPAACDFCFNLEKLGKSSHRKNNYRQWDSEKVFRQMTESERETGYCGRPPVDLDLRLGNACNAKCRSCFSDNSELLHKERQQIVKTANDLQNTEAMRWIEGDVNKAKDYSFLWYVDAPLMQDFKTLRLDRISLYGGEPTIHPEAKKLIFDMIESGAAEQTVLKIVTNGAVLNKLWLSAFEKFKNTILVLSLDAVGEHANFLRYPLRWDRIEKNLAEVLDSVAFKNRKIQISISYTVQMSNILSLTELYDWYARWLRRDVFQSERSLESKFRLHWNALHDPYFLSLSGAPEPLKTEAMAKLEKYRWIDRHQTGTIESLIQFIRSHNFDPSALREFLHYTSIVDRQRKQSFKETFPALFSFLSGEAFRSQQRPSPS
ncbi:MAG: twitch domain-containing radical SAM protein [Pseudomonadota bacterium]